MSKLDENEMEQPIKIDMYIEGKIKHISTEGSANVTAVQLIRERIKHFQKRCAKLPYTSKTADLIDAVNDAAYLLTLLQKGQEIVKMLYHDFPQDDEMVNDWLKAIAQPEDPE